MKILFISPSYKPAFVYGGPTVSVSELAEALVALGHCVTVYTTTANGEAELAVPTGAPTDINGVTVYYFRRQTGDHTHVSFSLWRKLGRTLKHFDVVHLQSWWSFLILGAAIICVLKKKAYVISPRGMLSRYSFQNLHSLPKKMIHFLVGKQLLKKSQLHATTELEWDDCHAVIPGWQGFVLPNLVHFPEYSLPSKRGEESGKESLRFGFLSRIDPKKGLELLLEGFALAAIDFQLVIAGTGEATYIEKLKCLAAQLNIAEKITWPGWIGGEDKFQFLASIDVFVLTSHNENFANSVLESLVSGTPVLLTNQVGLASYVERRQLGWVCSVESNSIADSIRQIYHESGRITAIHHSAPSIIREDFNRLLIAAQYINAYEQGDRKAIGREYSSL